MSTRRLTKGQAVVLSAAAIIMVGVGGFGAAGTFVNVTAKFHRTATAAGVVAAGEGLTLILALTMLGLTMLGQAAPLWVRGGLWLAPVSACFTGVAIADGITEAAVFGVTPLAMSGAAEGLGLIARRIVIYRTGVDAEVQRHNADVARQLAYNRAVADGHPDQRKKKAAVRRYWRLARYVGVGDTELGAGLVEVQRVRVRDGADAALAGMYGGADAVRSQKDLTNAPSPSLQDAVRRELTAMDPVDAIRIARDAHPDMPPGELAELLTLHGVPVAAVQVALVLGTRPPEYEVHRPDAADAPQVKALEAVTVEAAVVEAASILGPDAKAREIAEHIARNRRLVVTEPYVRTALSRAAKKTEMEGGYA